MKTKQGNDVIDLIGVTYAEKKKKKKLNYRDQLDQVSTVTKTK